MKIARAAVSVLRGFVAFLFLPTMAGALYLLLLAALARHAPAMGDSALVRDAHGITELPLARYGAEIRRTTRAIFAASIVLGAMIGLVAGLLVRLRDRLARLGRRSQHALALPALATTAVLHAWLMLLGMARAPQLYADAWYARGGLRRTVQVIATDVLGPGGVIAIGLVVLLAFLAGPIAQWPRWRGRLSRALLPHRNVWRRRASVVTTAVAIAILATLARAPIAEPSAIAASSDKPNIVILAADSLRADRVTPRVAPHLAALADRGVRFERAYASIPRALPSWVTLLTGRHAHHHGVRSMLARWEDRAKDFDALPQRLARGGYRTGVVSDSAGDIFTQIDLGFGLVDTPTFNARELVRRRAIEQQTPLLPLLHSHAGRRVFSVLREMPTASDPDMLADDAIHAIDKLRGAPFLLTVFFSAARFPYAAPAPYYDRYTRSAYRGRFKYDKPIAVAPSIPPDAEDIAQARGLYDGAVASVDDAAARVLDALAKKGLDRSTIVILVSDHGETLFENGRGQGHGDHLFGDEGTHVPLVIFDPRHPREAEALRPRGVVRDVDLAPTVYELTGIDPPQDLDGRSLVPAMRGAPIEAAPAYAETEVCLADPSSLPADLRMPTPPLGRITEIDEAHGDEVVLAKDALATSLVARHRMVREERWKLVYVPTRSHVAYMLFDTERDPGETRDVAADHPAEMARLKGELWQWMLRDPQMTEKGGYLVVREPATAKDVP